MATFGGPLALAPFHGDGATSGSLRFAAAVILRLIRMYQQATSALVSMSSRPVTATCLRQCRDRWRRPMWFQRALSVT